ncbi:MAG: hypothetical protein JNK34_10655 [Tabrizicola sp.]|nr:hypothetical protein [Tabrizicola sp.]
MVALSTERNTRARISDLRVEPVAAAVKIWGGSLVMRNAAGYLTKGATATGCVSVGRAEKTVDNTAGAAGAASVEYRIGLFLFANSAAGDLITIADIGKVCYIVDDQTVAKTDGTATRSRAGIVDGTDASGGVWVRFDEALARAA